MLREKNHHHKGASRPNSLGPQKVIIICGSPKTVILQHPFVFNVSHLLLFLFQGGSICLYIYIYIYLKDSFSILKGVGSKINNLNFLIQVYTEKYMQEDISRVAIEPPFILLHVSCQSWCHILLITGIVEFSQTKIKNVEKNLKGMIFTNTGHFLSTLAVN